MSLKVFSPQGNPRVNKLVVAAKLANVNLEVVTIPYDSLKTEENLIRHPLGKVPSAQTEEGFLFESNAILRHIARLNQGSGLYGTTLYQQSLVDQWLDFASCELEPVLLTLVIPVFGYYPLEPAQGNKAQADLALRLKALDNHLKGNNFLVGEKLTIADLQTLFLLTGFFRFVLGEESRKAYPNLMRYFNALYENPAILQVYGRPRLCKVPFPVLQFTQQQQQGKQQQQKQGKQEKGGKQEKQEKKKAEKKEEKKEEAVEEAPKKEKNPLDELPPSTFDIDAWKRQFLASQDFKKEFEWFWANLDEEGWSCWEVLYEKAEGEGANLLKTNNTMKGFLQRMDPHFRKYAFAIHGVYGEEPNLEIRGAWIWRGKDVAPQMKDHPSFEFHKLTKIDKNNQELKNMFEDYWVNQTEDESVVKGLRARTLAYYR